MPVRMMRPEEEGAVSQMMCELWPEAGAYDFSEEHVFVWERESGGLGGFASVSLRPWAEGCVSEPCPYIEGWYVAPDLRKRGVGKAIVEAIEEWCLASGHTELGSDVELDNEVSLKAHAAMGFEPVVRTQFFRKKLSKQGAT